MKIPVYLEGREIEHHQDHARGVERLYNKWWKIFGVRKIYWVPGKAFHMENKYRPAIIIKGHND